MGLVDHMNTLYNSSEGGGDMDDCVGRCCKIAFERPLFTARRIRGAYFHSALCYGPLGVCLSVCLFVTTRCSVEMAEWIELIFGTEATLGLCYTVR